VLGWKVNNVPRKYFSALNYPQNRQYFLLRGKAADASFRAKLVPGRRVDILDSKMI